MMPLPIPHLPTAPVTLVVTAGGIGGLEEALQALSINVFPVGANKNLDEYISCHADMLINHLGNKDILLSSEQSFIYNKLSELGFIVDYCHTAIISPYPKDVQLNTARVGNYLICNPKTTAHEILDYAKLNYIEIIAVKQGYAKCSICILNENAIITEDNGIKRACEKRGIDSLLVSKGSVKLKNKNYGFFGGCTGLLDKNKLGICGDLRKHTDYKKIMDFFNKHGIEPISLLDGDLTDIGGIIPLMQKSCI